MVFFDSPNVSRRVGATVLLLCHLRSYSFEYWVTGGLLRSPASFSKDTNRIHDSIWLSRGLYIIVGRSPASGKRRNCLHGMLRWRLSICELTREKWELSPREHCLWALSHFYSQSRRELTFCNPPQVSSRFSSTDRCVFGYILLSIGQTCFPGWRSKITIIFYFHMFRK